jgi:hypothetical protein
MRIIKLLNTISPEIYFNNIFEYLFGSRNYRITQYFLGKIKSVGLSNSKTTGEITINLLENKSFEIVCKKPFFFKQNFNSFQNMRIFKKKYNYIYKKVEKFISINSQYEKYTNTLSFNKSTFLIHPVN